MVLVGQDGVQRPAIHLPPGGHLLAFLTCLETGLQPHGRLDPPLWYEEGKGEFSLFFRAPIKTFNVFNSGKVFPKIKRRLPVVNGKANDENDANGNEESDETFESTAFVFRIITNVDNSFTNEQSSGKLFEIYKSI